MFHNWLFLNTWFFFYRLWIVELWPDFVSSIFKRHCWNIDLRLSLWLFLLWNFYCLSGFLNNLWLCFNLFHFCFFFSNWMWIVELWPDFICSFHECHSWDINFLFRLWNYFSFLSSRFNFLNWLFFNNWLRNDFHGLRFFINNYWLRII